MKVLVSGGAGFIGSTVASACLDAGIVPVIVDNLSTGSAGFLMDRIFYHGDIADGPLVDKAFAEHPDIDAVVHCAALTVVPESTADPVRYYRENVAKAIDFVDHVMRNGCRRFLFSSSASIYGAAAQLALDEAVPAAPTSPYARTKAMMEDILRDCARAHQLAVISLRYFNPIGADPQLRSGAPVRELPPVLDKMIAAAATGREFSLTGIDWPTRDGTGMRDYVHVWDLANAHVLALSRFDDAVSRVGEERYLAMNVGTGDGTTVLELLKVVETVVGGRVPVRETARRNGDVPGGYALSGKAREVLSWRPQKTLTDAVRDALRWAAVRERMLGADIPDPTAPSTPRVAPTATPATAPGR